MTRENREKSSFFGFQFKSDKGILTPKLDKLNVLSQSSGYRLALGLFKPKELHLKLAVFLVGIFFTGAIDARLSLPNIETVGSDADTEVIIPCSVQPCSSLMIDFTITNPTSSNAILLAFGKDLNADGELAIEEIKYQVGWEAGAWVVYSANAVDSEPLQLGVTDNRFTRHITTGDWDIANLIVRGDVAGRFFTGKAPTIILLR